MSEYEKADLNKKAGNINDRPFLLVHGTADMSIKPQHSLLFARSLIDQGVLFRHLVGYITYVHIVPIVYINTEKLSRQECFVVLGQIYRKLCNINNSLSYNL